VSVISFENVSKNYKLYSKGGLYLRDRISHALHRLNPFNDAQSSLTDKRQPLERDFAAIKDVSFDIKQGEAVGFIGRNGAGKSTILKLLASVTKPTSGKVSINGRVAALIEVGAGFHPELTGRENVFLNASILGMKKVEIEKRFDSIVGFAELEDFIDTPVKHYSSGMYVRLGFAIAVHSDPDIFLIDEVLAVGDESFQKKCLDTLAAHKAAGKTMILVSHDLAKVEEVCGRCIYVDHGQIRYDGAASKAINHYRRDIAGTLTPQGLNQDDHAESDVRIIEVVLRDREGTERASFRTGDEVILELRFNAAQRIMEPVFGIAIVGSKGELVSGFNTLTNSFRIPYVERQGAICCRLIDLPLQKGTYSINVDIHTADYSYTYAHQINIGGLEIGGPNQHVSGLVALRSEWFQASEQKWAKPISRTSSVTQ
jgi:ABC-type polysaccharide/polyol phosphate transport system ATPase subunit